MPSSEVSDLTLHHYVKVFFFSNDSQFPSVAGDTLSPTFYKAVIILQAIYGVQRVSVFGCHVNEYQANQKT